MRGAGCLLFAVAVGGCAFTNVPVKLPDHVATQLTGGDARQVVVVAPFVDQRNRKDCCGIQKNGYNAETAKALCSADPATWIAEVLSGALRDAGFTVVAAAGTTRPGALVVNGTLSQFFVEPVIGFSAVALETDIDVQLRVTSQTGLIAERAFFVKGVESGQIARAGNFQRSVDTAVDQVVKDMVAALITLANRYPQLGLRQAADAPSSLARAEVR